MKSIIHTETGPASVLRLEERPLPVPGAGEVRVRVVVSGVNPTDWKSRRGRGDGQALAFPEITPNQDGAGVVDAVGPGVSDLAAGDRVWTCMAAQGRPTGTAQEFTVLPAERVVRLPDGVSFDVGASLGVPAVTAHRALTVAEDGPRRLAPGALAGRTVLVSGGAGAVGHAAIQLARWAGARVVTTVSGPEKARLATAAGADHVVNYREGDPAAAIREVAPEGVDLVVEVAIAPNLELDQAVVRPRASIASYANNGGDDVRVDIRAHMVLNTRLQFILMYTMGDEALSAAFEDITAALRDGALPVGEEHGLPLLRFPLERTAAAHEAVEGDAVGKVLVDVADPGSVVPA
ncbi:NADPH2:quinone reductase [Kineococcus radiotolerans]|uniref:NADPH2:quinone reductase n=1 Tax=Kineococcus radiotolerans TaxID=131568 RepID=A0A7W4TMZ6_KINRA|nr:NADPH:quinone reductase [Kineococcus radiotolerans]MBB2901928.1 NADPH2:quinone reductase [Kineococcus radiotolerans]